VPLGPTVRRRRLGAELRRLREAHSLKLEEVAERLGLAPSTLSRIETGKAPTKSAYLTAMLEMYKVEDPGARKVLVDMAREGHRTGWWSIYDDVLPSGFDIYVGLEAEASGLRSYETDVVHGLLQTTDYALAVLRELRPRDTEEQLQRVVDLRMQRQRLLDQEPPLDLWLILDEGAIRRNVGGSAVMRRQLEHLVQASRWSNVTLQILSFESGAHAGRFRGRLHRIRRRHDLPGKRPGSTGLRRGFRPDARGRALPGCIGRAHPGSVARAQLIMT
jgi:transcriptional regulator with XRE-family HTH domain